MKKILRIFTLATILLLQCFLLSGCDALDELREKQAYYTEDRKIVYNDAVFVLLPENELLQPVYDYSADCQLNITGKDVPVLLSSMLSERTLYMTEDGIFLCGYDDTRNGNIVYCREDKYDEIVARMKEEFKPTKACYFYNIYDTETYENSGGHYVLSDEEFSAVKEVMITTTASNLPSNAYIEYDYTISLELCSEDLLFRKYAMDISLLDNQYYIIYHSEDDTTSIYTVPDSYNEIFSNILKDGMEAEINYHMEYEDYEYSI